MQTNSNDNSNLPTLTLLCIGIVYGDIGTSPLYAFREAIAYLAESGKLYQTEIIGVLSLMVWALLITVTLKYVIILLQVDNNGEGGILSLVALVKKTLGDKTGVLLIFGLVGASLFFADAAITPAISVLSAIEGLKVVAPGLERMVLPISVLILIILFMFQHRGTKNVAFYFGPIVTIWFLVIGVTGLASIYHNPIVLIAFNPMYAVTFLWSHGIISLFVLGAVFLTVTGAEALYSDLGHFGKTPIRYAWLFLVLPALLLNYLGQGALVLRDSSSLANPFFFLVPKWGIIPMVVLATLATIIASQAVITGAFSLTRQAIQLKLLPRMNILHTSSEKEGQIYLPKINFLLLFAVLFLCITFESSENLASAYGIAVSGDMIITTILVFFILSKIRRGKFVYLTMLLLVFFVIEVTYFAANLLKIFHGGIIPLLFAAFLVFLMLVWTRGVRHLELRTNKQAILLSDLASMLENDSPQTVQGTAIFLTSNSLYAPLAFTHNLKHNKVLHEKNIVLTIHTPDTPKVPDKQKLDIEQISPKIVRITAQFGYMEMPNMLKILALARDKKININTDETSYYISRRNLVAGRRTGFAGLRNKVYLALFKSAAHVTDFYRIPPNRVIELGAQFTI